MKTNDTKLVVPSSILTAWQEIVDTLAEVFRVPAALVMILNDPDIEVLISSRSEGNPYTPGSKEHLWDSGLYCERVIKTRDRLLIPDALADPEWESNPDVKLNMVSYLGLPVMMPDGRPFGTICVLDNKKNEYSSVFEKLLSKFRDFIQWDIEILYVNKELGDENRRLIDYLRELQTLRGMISICASCKSVLDDQGNWHPIEEYLIRHPEAKFSHGLCPRCMNKLYPGMSEE
ncbi:MAG: GAF domain-containing protein [Verrucomicrobia bacterium]|nr:GAF domain-containing protein [Verrucomicrobiota bacterium]MCF7708813.1 GAF domain-containing protein [Verrucomicrobiota bacterium]